LPTAKRLPLDRIREDSRPFASEKEEAFDEAGRAILFGGRDAWLRHPPSMPCATLRRTP